MNTQTKHYEAIVLRAGINRTYWLNQARECDYLYKDSKSVLSDALEQQLDRWLDKEEAKKVDCYEIAEDLLEELESNWYYLLN